MFELLLKPPGVGGGARLLLDTLASAFKGAYSSRKLRAGYAGAGLRVRRSSDSAEQDIGFSGLWLDTTALTSFVGSGSGYVSKWYDQSGNGNDLAMATTANQPRIVNAGTVDNFGDTNSRPCLYFGGGNVALACTLTTGRTDTKHGIFGVASGGGAAGAARLLGTMGNGATADYASNGFINAILDTGSNLNGYWNNVFLNGSAWSTGTARHQFSAYEDAGGFYNVSVDGAAAGTHGLAQSISEPRTLTLGNAPVPNTGTGWVGHICEILYFANAPASGDPPAARSDQQAAFGTA